MTQKDIIDLLEKNGGITKSSVYSSRNESDITDIIYNSKACTVGSAFFIKGVNFKTEYIEEAVKNGATLVIAEKEYDTYGAGTIVVPNIRHAMAVVAEKFFDEAYKKIHLVGLTGTKGKTTTATYINNVLNEYVGKKTGMLSTIQTYTGARNEESHLSTPEAIELQRYIKEAVDNDLKFLTMEVSSQAYKKERIFGMQFEIGLFLNISEDHISPAEHPNFTDYLNCKLEFIKNCKTVVVNYETDYLDSVMEAAKNAQKIITYGSKKVKDKVDYYYDNIQRINGMLEFDVIHDGQPHTYKTQMIGDFNVGNALAAIIVGELYNISMEKIKLGIEKTIVSGRMNVFSKDEKTVIVDYAHNKLSFEKFFETIKKDFPDSDIYSVFGAPGGKAYGRRKDMAEVASKYCKKIYLTTDDPQFENAIDICNEIASFVTCDYEILLDRETAINKAFTNMKKKDVLCLLAKGEDKYQQVKGKFEPYDSDVTIAKKICE